MAGADPGVHRAGAGAAGRAGRAGALPVRAQRAARPQPLAAVHAAAVPAVPRRGLRRDDHRDRAGRDLLVPARRGAGAGQALHGAPGALALHRLHRAVPQHPAAAADLRVPARAAALRHQPADPVEARRADHPGQRGRDRRGLPGRASSRWTAASPRPRAALGLRDGRRDARGDPAAGDPAGGARRWSPSSSRCSRTPRWATW